MSDGGLEKIPTIRIERPLPKDAHEILSVMKEAWLQSYAGHEGITKEQIEAFFEARMSDKELRSFQNELNLDLITTTSFTFVAKEGGKIVGFCQGNLIGRRNDLGTLYVLPEYQRKKIGRTLWEKARSAFNPTFPTTLRVARFNKDAIRLYEEEFGFKPTDVVVAPYMLPDGGEIHQMLMSREPEKESTRSYKNSWR